MSNFIESKHNNIILDNDLVGNALLDATLARDLPGMADIESSLLLFCSEVKKNHTVVLSGECADEIFGGYPWFTNEEKQAHSDIHRSGNKVKKPNLIQDKN